MRWVWDSPTSFGAQIGKLVPNEPTKKTSKTDFCLLFPALANPSPFLSFLPSPPCPPKSDPCHRDGNGNWRSRRRHSFLRIFSFFSHVLLVTLFSSESKRGGGGSHSVTTILTLYKPRRHFSPSLAIIVHRLIAAQEACIMGNAHSRPHSLWVCPLPLPRSTSSYSVRQKGIPPSFSFQAPPPTCVRARLNQ